MFAELGEFETGGNASLPQEGGCPWRMSKLDRLRVVQHQYRTDTNGASSL